jgi:replicative DNA helicase
MSADQLASRILAEQTEISSEKLRRGQLNDEQFEQIVLASQQLENIPLYIDDTPAVSISTIASRCRRLKRQVGLHFVVIDYIQLVRPSQSSKRSENRVQEITEITQGLKALAKELNVPVLALSQLSRSVESRDDKRPQLSDLRESGSIEQDADVVCFVFREEYYIGRKEPREGTPEHEKWQMEIDQVRNLAEVIIGKQRHGPIGNVKLHFNSEFTRFADLAPNYR